MLEGKGECYEVHELRRGVERYIRSSAADLADHLQRQHEELSHARVKATMAPGAAAAACFAAMYPYSGAWSAVSTLEMLGACPPSEAHTGPDGEALRRVPLTFDVDAEFVCCYGAHGPGAPFGSASFGRTNLAMARLMISHANGTAIYGTDPKQQTHELDLGSDEMHLGSDDMFGGIDLPAEVYESCWLSTDQLASTHGAGSSEKRG